MPVKIQFSHNHRVALYTWTDPVKLVDFEYAFNTIGAAYEQVSGPIHTRIASFRVPILVF